MQPLDHFPEGSFFDDGMDRHPVGICQRHDSRRAQAGHDGADVVQSAARGVHHHVLEAAGGKHAADAQQQAIERGAAPLVGQCCEIRHQHSLGLQHRRDRAQVMEQERAAGCSQVGNRLGHAQRRRHLDRAGDLHDLDRHAQPLEVLADDVGEGGGDALVAKVLRLRDVRLFGHGDHQAAGREAERRELAHAVGDAPLDQQVAPDDASVHRAIGDVAGDVVVAPIEDGEREVAAGREEPVAVTVELQPASVQQRKRVLRQPAVFLHREPQRPLWAPGRRVHRDQIATLFLMSPMLANRRLPRRVMLYVETTY